MKGNNKNFPSLLLFFCLFFTNSQPKLILMPKRHILRWQILLPHSWYYFAVEAARTPGVGHRLLIMFSLTQGEKSSPYGGKPGAMGAS